MHGWCHGLCLLELACHSPFLAAGRVFEEICEVLR